MKTIDSETFYNLMQVYRCTNTECVADVAAAYKAVVDYVDNIAEPKQDASKNRYFTNRHGFACSTDCIVFTPTGGVYRLDRDGTWCELFHYKLQNALDFVSDGTWIEFIPRGE